MELWDPKYPLLGETNPQKVWDRELAMRFQREFDLPLRPNRPLIDVKEDVQIISVREKIANRYREQLTYNKEDENETAGLNQ